MADALDALREFAFDDGAGGPLVITVEKPLTPHGQRLADALGVEVRVTAVPAHLATASADCVLPGCPMEAESGQDFCRLHLSTRGASTMECKVEGCENQAADLRGIYAHLCLTHKAEARRQRAESPPPRALPPAGALLADRARKLVPLATKLDRARAQLASLPEQTIAKAAVDEASRRAVQSPTADNLARVGETLKQLLTTAPKRTKLENDVVQAERALGLALQSFVTEARAA